MLDGDPALNAWALNWVTRALSSDWSTVLQGNVFHPTSGAIRLSEHMFTLAIFNLPIRAITQNPWVGYNLAILAAYLLSALGGYRLITELTKSTLAGYWGALFWAFCFYRVHHIGHLQILSYQWFPFIALYLLRMIKTPSLINATLFSLFFILQSLTSWYLAVISSVFVLILFVCNTSASSMRPTNFAIYLFAAALVLSAVLPFAYSYASILSASSLGERLSAIHVSSDNVQLRDFFFPPTATYLGSLIADNKYWIWGENTLYISFIACLLALLGAPYAWRHDRRMLVASLALIAVGFTFALGYHSSAWGMKLPLYYLSQVFPPLAAIRATQRYALLIYFGVLLLSGFGVASILGQSVKPVRVALTLGLSIIFLFEVYPYKLPFGAPGQYTPSALDLRIKGEIGADEKVPVILHLPIHTTLAGYPTAEAIYMVDSTLHWGKIVNGFSGAEPRGFKQDMLTLSHLPNPESLALIKKYGVTILAVHRSLASDQKDAIKAHFQSTGHDRVLEVDRDEYLVFLNSTP